MDRRPQLQDARLAEFGPVSHPVTEGPRLESLRLLFVGFTALVLARIGIGALLLNTVMNYTADGGSPAEKIHPAFYGLVLVAAAVALTRRIELGPQDLAILRAVLLLLACTVIVLTIPMLGGRSSTASAGFVMDTYWVACPAAFVLMAVPDGWRTVLARLVLMFLLASAVVGIVEFATRARLLPYSGGEEFFRPTGLTDHPLEFGQWCAVAIGFVGVARWRPGASLGASALLLIGALTSGARIASLVAIAMALAGMLLNPLPARSDADRRERKLLLVTVGAVVLGGMVAILAYAGALDRLGGGLVDQSSRARVDVYRVFDNLSWHHLIFGTDFEAVKAYAANVLGLPFIESSVVVFTVLFGVPGAALFAVALGCLFLALLRGRSPMTRLATLAYLVLALSNNGLSSKTPDILLMVILIMCDRTTPRSLGDA